MASVNRDADVKQSLMLLLSHHEVIMEEDDEGEMAGKAVTEGVKEGVEGEDSKGSLLATGVASALKRSVSVCVLNAIRDMAFLVHQ